MYAPCLFLLLASPHHSTREAAERELTHRVTGWPHRYGAQVEQWAKATTCPERRFRLRKPVIAYRAWVASRYTLPKDVPVWPCCDMFPGPSESQPRNRTFAARWYDRAAILCDDRIRGGPYWNQYRHATELMARSLIAEGWKPVEVDALLRDMWRLELACNCDGSCPRAELETWQWETGYPIP